MDYFLTDLETGIKYRNDFKPGDFHRIVVDPVDAGVDGWQPTLDQARNQISIWNRAQAAHRQEFAYSLA